MLHALYMRVWVGPPAAPTVVGNGAGAAPDCVCVLCMLSTHPKVGMPRDGPNLCVNLSRGRC